MEENTSSAARWEAGKAAVARGTAATAVDAGFEWMGWHYPRIVGDGTGPRLWRDPATWYNVLKFPSAGNCVLMSFAQRRESVVEPHRSPEVPTVRALGEAVPLRLPESPGVCRRSVVTQGRDK